jgi:hypothetical protein
MPPHIRATPWCLYQNTAQHKASPAMCTCTAVFIINNFWQNNQGHIWTTHYQLSLREVWVNMTQSRFWQNSVWLHPRNLQLNRNLCHNISYISSLFTTQTKSYSSSKHRIHHFFLSSSSFISFSSHDSNTINIVQYLIKKFNHMYREMPYMFNKPRS